MELIPGLPDEIARECLIRVPYTQFCTASDVCKGWKEEVSSVQFHRRRKVSGLNRAIIVFTQDESSPASGPVKYPLTPAYRLTFYEPVTGVWGMLPPIPGYSDGLPLFCQCAGVGRYLVVIGGWIPTSWDVSNAVYVYDFVSATWQRGVDMPGASRSFFACASDSDRMVFVAGGHDEEKNALRSALAYNVIKDKWVPLPDMARERDECKGVYHGGKFHVISGYSTEMQGQFARSAEAFHVATWQWDLVKENMMQTGVCPRTCVVDEDGNIYRCLSGHVAVLEGDIWQPLTELPPDVRMAPYVVMWQENLLVIGSAGTGGPHSGYMLKLLEKEKHYTWTKVEIPEEFTGHVQIGCSLEI